MSSVSSSSRWGPAKQPTAPPPPPPPPPPPFASASLSSQAAPPPAAAALPRTRTPPPPPPQDNTAATTTASTSTSTVGGGAAMDLPTDFEVMTEVEWGPAKDDVDYDTDQELAPKPKKAPVELCECSMPPPGSGQVCCRDNSCILFACWEECSRKCPAGMACGNRRLQQPDLLPPTEVFDAGPEKGRGLRLLQSVQQGDVIIEYTGQAVLQKHLNRLFRRYQLDRRLYIMALGDGVYLDARTKGGTARFINHSCEPNCRVERWKVRGILRAAVVALQDLEAGTELTFDYQWERKKGRAPTKCHCYSKTCRGTLEVAKSMEEAALEKDFSGHWKRGANAKNSTTTTTTTNEVLVQADQTLVNRVVKIYSQEHAEYFWGEVTGYNPAAADGKRHAILYRHDLSEAWEDLRQEEWMVLDDSHLQPAESKVIAKKVVSSKRTSPTSMLLQGQPLPPAAAAPLAAAASSAGSSFLRNMKQQQGGYRPAGYYTKHYLHVQTPIKEAIWSKPFFLERCERTCGVQISHQQLARPPLPCDRSNPEEVEKYAALDQSLDGTVWKLSITGSDVRKAYDILTKSVLYWEKKLAAQELAAAAGGPSQQPQHQHHVPPPPPPPPAATDELLIPRTLVEPVKERLPGVLRDACRGSVTFTLPKKATAAAAAAASLDTAKTTTTLSHAPSHHQRLVLQGSLVSDVRSAKDHVWNFLMRLAVEHKLLAPAAAAATVPRHLASLGGNLTAAQCRLLLLNSSGDNDNNDQQQQPDDWNESPFIRSFESTYRCTIWVEPSSAQQQQQPSPNANGNTAAAFLHNNKIFFGCAPKDIPRFWGLVQARVKEVERGVLFYHLGADRIYQPVMMKQGGRFFDYVKQVTGATVMIDSVTGNHLKIDGRRSAAVCLAPPPPPAVLQLSEQERACLAQEVVRLQIELYRDCSIRESPWMFGRDWTLMGGTGKTTGGAGSGHGTSLSPMNAGEAALPKTRGNVDLASAPQGGMDIAETVSRLGLPRSVGAHAAIILYRFVSSNQQAVPIKLREALLACVFLANKSQKRTKWSRLEAVLEAGYKTFYQGLEFDRKKEEVAVLEEKVITAEAEILKTLQYDVFWRDIDWITVAATGAGEMKESFVEDIFGFAFSGQVLSAGAELWLKYGPEYVFAASAAFLKANLGKLLPALSLIPLKVSQAAELLVERAKVGPPPTNYSPSHIMLESGKERLKRQLPRIKEACVAAMKESFSAQGSSAPTGSVTTQRYAVIAKQSRLQRKLVGLPKELVTTKIIPALDGISAESGAYLFLAEAEGRNTSDVVMEGHWRAMALAEQLLGEEVEEQITLGSSVFSPFDPKDRPRLQVKTRPGLMNADESPVKGGWEGAIQSRSAALARSSRLGGKNCFPVEVGESSLREAGLRWWISPQHGPSSTGSLSDMHLARFPSVDHLQVLAAMVKSVMGGFDGFPRLKSMLKGGGDDEERSVAVSLQRWPPQKVENKENKSSRKSSDKKMRIGFSAGALQEVQLLTQLHSVVPGPQGHPNVVLPICITMPQTKDSSESSSKKKSPEPELSPYDDPMVFSLFRSSEETADKVSETDKKVRASPHIAHQPTPFILSRFISRKFDLAISPVIITSWCHDLLSALVHCHSNHVVLRTIQPDQILVDHAGVVKLGSLYRSTVLSAEERNEEFNVLEVTRASKKKDSSSDDEKPNPLEAPELLLGCPKHSKESDIWAIGCLLASLLLNKPLFAGKDRVSLLQAQYKIVGTPSSSNFNDASRLPRYRKPSKKYKRGVDRALQHMLKKQEDKSSQCAGLIDLIARMLHLDPAERCTAAEALGHDCMMEYVETSSSQESDSFRRAYVDAWLDVKRRMLAPVGDGGDAERTKKRKAMLIAAAGATATSDNHKGEDGDDLYDMGDLLDVSAGSSKKARTM